MSPPTVPPPRRTIENRTILIIDDDPDFREFVSIVLESHGYRVFEAANAPAGLGLMPRHTSAPGSAGCHDVL